MTVQFADNFWGNGSEYTGNYKGFEALHNRLLEGRSMGDAFVTFCQKRQEIERSYGQAMMKLVNSVQHKDTHGELRSCWDSMLSSVSSIGQSHILTADKLQNDSIPKLRTFNAQQKSNRKAGVESFKKAQASRLKAYDKVQRTQKTYQTKCSEFDAVEAQVNNPGSLNAKEIERMKIKKGKCKTAADSAEIAYQEAVRSHKDIQLGWEAEFETCCNSFQNSEEQRIETFKEEITNIAIADEHTAKEDQKNAENVLAALEHVNVANEIEALVNKIKTGTRRLEPIKYQDYYHPEASTETANDVTKEEDFGDPTRAFAAPMAEQMGPSDNPNADENHTFRAQFDYTAQSEAELNLLAGDYVQIVSFEEDPWWEGICNGERGMVYGEFLVPPDQYEEDDEDDEEFE